MNLKKYGCLLLVIYLLRNVIYVIVLAIIFLICYFLYGIL